MEWWVLLGRSHLLTYTMEKWDKKVPSKIGVVARGAGSQVAGVDIHHGAVGVERQTRLASLCDVLLQESEAGL